MRDDYMCQYSLKNGKRVNANTVHHIFPADQYPQYRYCDWNLISLSSEVHNMMHDRATRELTDMGEQLRRETAVKMGIEGEQTILVIGNPGSGKTRYVYDRIADGVVYDLDYIAAAFRLTKPKEDKCKAARMLANSLLPGFTEAAHRYCERVYVVRTAPTIEEVQNINPTKLVALYGNYGNKKIPDKRRHEISRRIIDCVEYAKEIGIDVEEINTDNYL